MAATVSASKPANPDESYSPGPKPDVVPGKADMRQILSQATEPSSDGFPFHDSSHDQATSAIVDDHGHQPGDGSRRPPAQGRRSVQFARNESFLDPPNTTIGHKQQASVDSIGPESSSIPQGSRERLRARMRALGLPNKTPARGKAKEAASDNVTADRNLAASDFDSHGDGNQADAELSGAESSAPETPAIPTRRRRRLSWSFSHTEPTTPKTPGANEHSPISRNTARPFLPVRRATMTDMSEAQREAVSEDEGRARMAGSPSWRRKGNAWLQGSHNESSFAARRRSRADNSEESRPSNLRRLTQRMGTSSNLDGTPAGWRARSDMLRGKIRIGLKSLGPRRKEKGVDYTKSAELLAELLAGSPAALILASNFTRDEHKKKKVPILLEQLKIRIPDIDVSNEPSTRHVKFHIQLEYGNGNIRMNWEIWRYLQDFINLHAKYVSSNLIGLRRRGGAAGQKKLPKFPTGAFPILRGFRGLRKTLGDDDAEQPPAPITQVTSPGEGPSVPPTPAPQADVRRRAHHGRSFSADASAILRRSSTAGQEGSGPDTPAVSKREAFQEQQRRKLEDYLRAMIHCFIFQAGSNRLCRFLEISALGVRLAAEGGYHGKEGLLYSKVNTISELPKTKARWYLVRQSYIVCVESPEDVLLADVFLVDSDFKCLARRPRIRDQKSAKEMAKTAKSAASQPKHHRLKIQNAERQLTLYARNERQQEQFAQSIEYMAANTDWAKPHRFGSFAPVRHNVFAEWLVDGRDYMWKVSRAISLAEHAIYIHDWWLSPELYMRRPPIISRKWRLDRLLQRKAQEGVKIYIIMYRNINSAIPIDSEYSKLSLLDLHPNIYVQRSPNNLRQNVFFWAHHEKICVVDHLVGFCGGVDLCFGRWDTPEHRLVDDKLTGFEPGDFPRNGDHCQLWPGKDYSNPRVQDFFNLDEPYEEMYDRTQTPRMPWHDIGMMFVGQPARDLTRHFVQRWNYLLRQRTPHRPIGMLIPPPDLKNEDLEKAGFSGTCEIQVLRSSSEWSIGTPNKVEHSIQEAYIKLIEKSEHFVYIENQFFISSCWVESTQIHNRIGDALAERIIRANKNDEDWMAVIVIPLMPGFQNLVHEQDGTSVRLIMQCQFRSICRGESSIFGRLRAQGIEPTDYIQFYSLRQWAKIGPQKALTTEQLYIHAKCMVVDDRFAIIGSANINERSMTGSRDSEIASVIFDNDMLDSTMAGKSYRVGRFPHTLRIRLMREHLGIDVDGIREAELENYYAQKKHKRNQKQNADANDATAEPSGSKPSSSGQTTLRDDEAVHDGEGPLKSTFAAEDTAKADKELVNSPLGNLLSGRIGTPTFGSDTRHEPPMPDTEVDDLVQHGRDSVVLENHQEVLVNNFDAEGKGTLRKPLKLSRKSKVDDHDDMAGDGGILEAVLPPSRLPRAQTNELGLTLRSQLPPLPDSDDTDIGGPPLKAAPSSTSHSELLRGLFEGMQRPQITDDCMKDPLNDGFLQDIWHSVAENNTKVFRAVFRCQPDNEVTDWDEYWAFSNYSDKFKASQGVSDVQPKAPTNNTPSRTGPPGVGTEKDTSVIGKLAEQPRNHEDSRNGGSDLEKSLSGATHEGKSSVQGSDRSNANASKEKVLDEKQSESTEESRKPQIEFGLMPSKDGRSNDGALQEKISNASIAAAQRGEASGNSSVRRRRRATTKSSARVPETVLSKATAEEALQLVQGHLVVFPYEWLVKEESGSKWLYGVDQMAPLEIYD